MSLNYFHNEQPIFQQQQQYVLPTQMNDYDIYDCLVNFDQGFRAKRSSTNLQLQSNFNKSTEILTFPQIAHKKVDTKNRLGEYKKNICGYITKKTIREFIGGDYKFIVTKLCQYEGINYESTVMYYSSRLQKVTGPTHIQKLLISYKEQYIKISKVFLRFFLYFLRQRYTRYLMTEGRMHGKHLYIKYKNEQLIPMLQKVQKKLNKHIVV